MKTTNPYRRWSVMLLGSHGQIIQLYRFKILFWGLFIIFAAALGAAAFFYYRHQGQAAAIQDLTVQVATLEKQITEVTRQNEAWRVRQAVIQKVNGTKGPQAVVSEGDAAVPAGDGAGRPVAAAGVAEQAGADEDGEPPAEAPSRPPEVAVPEPGAWEKLPAESNVAAGLEPAPLKKNRKVAVSHFKTRPLPDVAQLKISFRVTNESRSLGKLKGFTYVLLEGSPDGVPHHIIVPAGLASGERPPLQTQGYNFSVLNYLTIRMTAEAIQDAAWIHQATVFVCDEEGTLLAEERIPLDTDE